MMTVSPAYCKHECTSFHYRLFPYRLFFQSHLTHFKPGLCVRLLVYGDQFTVGPVFVSCCVVFWSNLCTQCNVVLFEGQSVALHVCYCFFSEVCDGLGSNLLFTFNLRLGFVGCDTTCVWSIGLWVCTLYDISLNCAL